MFAASHRGNLLLESTKCVYCLQATFEYLAGRYQQQRASFLIRYQVAMQTPSVVSIYLYVLTATEPALCDALYSHLGGTTNRHELRLLVAIYMTVMRVALEEWLEQEARGDLVSLLRQYLDSISSLSHNI